MTFIRLTWILIFGRKSAMCKISYGSFRLLPQKSNHRIPGRDFHTATLVDGKIVIFGGRCKYVMTCALQKFLFLKFKVMKPDMTRLFLNIC